MRNNILLDATDPLLDRAWSITPTSIYGFLVGILLLYSILVTLYTMRLMRQLQKLMEMNAQALHETAQANTTLAGAITAMSESQKHRDERLLSEMRLSFREEILPLRPRH